MTTVLFDTLEAAKKLEGAGFNPAQTEVLVQTIHHAVNENVATKADLKELGTKTETDLNRVETNLRADMNLLRWMVGFNLALTAAGVVALLFR